MQRFFDIIFSLFALIILAPLLVPIALVLKLTGEHDIFYVQERIGKGGVPFGLLKFATMLRNSPNVGTGDITVKNDPRVLPFGSFLRKSKINELPQLLNILKGDMSIVGPRPMVPKTYKNYGEKGIEVYSVRPGLTGIGSIIFRDEEKHLDNQSDPMAFYVKIIIPYKTKIELWYLERKSIFMYFQIIFFTAWVIIKPKSNWYQDIFDELPELPSELL